MRLVSVRVRSNSRYLSRGPGRERAMISQCLQSDEATKNLPPLPLSGRTMISRNASDGSSSRRWASMGPFREASSEYPDEVVYDAEPSTLGRG